MHLTLAVFGRWGYGRKFPPGNIWRGKRRLVRKVYPHDVENATHSLDVEEKNMFYLRHPYLKKEEYAGVGRNYFRTTLKLFESVRERRREKFHAVAEPRLVESHFRLRLLKDNKWE